MVNNPCRLFSIALEKKVSLVIIILLREIIKQLLEVFFLLIITHSSQIIAIKDHPSILIFSRSFGALTHLPFFIILYFIDLPIYFSVADLDRMSRMFSLRFISEILSCSNLHCDLAVRYTFSYIPTCISQRHFSFLSFSLLRLRLIYLSSPFALFLFHAFLYLVLSFVSVGFDACSLV